MLCQAIPDASAAVLHVVAEGDKAVVVDSFGGTHRGEFFGRPGTGDRIEWTAIHIYTIRDGKVLEDAVMTDALAIMQQLGLEPGLTKAAEQGGGDGRESNGAFYPRRSRCRNWRLDRSSVHQVRAFGF